jgi:hypothetical protein
MEYKVYYLRESEDYEKQKYDCAIAPDFVDSIWVYQGCVLKDGEEEKEWKEPTFEVTYGGFPDYLSNDCSWILCSEKLKEVIIKNANNASDVLWFPVKVINGETFKTYYALLIEHFLKDEEIVNYEKSKKLKSGEVYLPHLKYDKIKNFDLFVMENNGVSLFISQKLKDILEKENLTGLGFEDWKAS